MMANRSLILQVAARGLVPILLLFSVFLLLRGHHEPGGGFTGGLLAAGAFVLDALAVGVDEARRRMRIRPRRLIGLGLLIALASAFFGPAVSKPFFSSVWPTPSLGSPLVFDFGVYVVVIGVVTLILFTLQEEV